MPVVLFGKDIAVSASQILPELMGPTERGTSNIIHATWRSKKGETVVHYFYDEGSHPNVQLFEQAARTWAAHTCISFEKTDQTNCSDTVFYPSFCVGNFKGCWSFVGKSGWGGEKTGKGKAQRLSVDNNCELDACIHEFGHGLGFQHQQSRPDRDAFLSINWENFKVSGGSGKGWEKSLRNTWMQGTMCSERQVADIPTPFDYLSVMQYGSFSFVDNDIRATFVTKNELYQWMLDYHRDRGMGPSHYDYLVINTSYKCIDAWKKACQENNQTVPKCENFGYLTKSCTCKCPTGYTGPTCKNSTGPIFPRLEKAECFIQWNYPGIIDMANMDFDFRKRSYANRRFNYMQFCTIVVDTKREDQRPIIWLDPSELMVKRRKLIDLLHQTEFVTHVLPQFYLFDCRLFYKLFWTSDTNNRKRTECFSSIFNVGSKVTKEKMLTLRSKQHILWMYFNVVYQWSHPATEFLEAAMKLKLQVNFEPIPQRELYRADDFVEGPETTMGPTGLPPTIPPELRFETTTPNILGIPLPMIFQHEENPRLVFFGWLLIGVGALFFMFFLGVCVSEQLQLREILRSADRQAALNESQLLASGWVMLRGVDVDSEVKQARADRRARTSLAAALFEDSDSDSDDAGRKKRMMQEKARKAQAKKGKNAKGKGIKTRVQLMKERAAAEDSSSSSEEEQPVKKVTKPKPKPVKDKKEPERRKSIFTPQKKEEEKHGNKLMRLMASKGKDDDDDSSSYSDSPDCADKERRKSHLPNIHLGKKPPEEERPKRWFER
ncbi:uncharacterized protein LOC122374971 [Amphibalanus amphitrite]|uniref:uncharacterized protein LOC122374971 n=1 Tax=Amphibalanus amphitrite TaxID=1232801 RepID=UPI001C920874|nr:uncharacterized protein LOC122374971 [Amphibalanus amphitrite]